MNHAVPEQRTLPRWRLPSLRACIAVRLADNAWKGRLVSTVTRALADRAKRWRKPWGRILGRRRRAARAVCYSAGEMTGASPTAKGLIASCLMLAGLALGGLAALDWAGYTGFLVSLIWL